MFQNAALLGYTHCPRGSLTHLHKIGPFIKILHIKVWWQDVTLLVYFHIFITYIHSFNHNTFIRLHSLKPLSTSSSLVCSVGKTNLWRRATYNRRWKHTVLDIKIASIGMTSFYSLSIPWQWKLNNSQGPPQNLPVYISQHLHASLLFFLLSV